MLSGFIINGIWLIAMLVVIGLVILTGLVLNGWE